MQVAIALANEASERAGTLLTIVLVVIGLGLALLVALVIGAGLKAVMVSIKRATFTGLPRNPSDGPRPGPRAYLWMATIVIAGCTAFIFSSGWLWAVTGLTAGLLIAVYAYGDEETTN